MSEETEPKPKPRRKWLKRLGFLGILAIIFGIWANGPGVRWAIDSVLSDQLEKQNLSGAFTVSGTLLSGLALEKISLKSEGQIQKITADRAAVVWSLKSLLAKQLEEIEVSNLVVQLDFDAPAPAEEKPEEDSSESSPMAETLDLVRGFLEPADISITNLDLGVTVADKNFHLSLASLAHSPGEQTYQLNNFDLTDHLGRTATNEQSTITWNQTEITLDHLQLLPALGTQNLAYQIDGGVSGEILLADAKFSATSDLAKDFSLTLDSPSLDIKKVISLYDDTLPASGTITRLSLTPNQAQLEGTDIRYEDHHVKTLSLDGSLKDRDIDLDLAVIYQGDDISLKASGKNQFDVFNKETTIELKYRDQLSASGKLILNEEILESSAELNFHLTYPDVPEVSGHVAFRDQKVALTANALEGVTVKAGYDIDASNYTAEINADLEDGTPLHELLKGPLSLTATASGNIPDNTHRGSLDLKNVTVENPQLTASSKASWDWPRSVAIEGLRINTPEGQLAGDLSWGDDLLTVSTLKLVEEDITLLNAEGKLPAPLSTRSFDDILADKTPFEFSLKSQPLSFKRLRNYVPIPENLAGVVEANFDLSGNLANPQINGMASLIDFRVTDQPKIPPADLRLVLKTEEQNLHIDGSVREPGGPLVDLNGKVAFLPEVWMNQKKNPNDATIDLTVQTPELDLKRVQPFAPTIRSITGTLESKVRITGTVTDPSYTGEITASLKKLSLSGSPIEDIRDGNFRITAEGKTVTIHPSSVMAAGGTIRLSGEVELSGEEPEFDLSLSGRHVLLTRNADYTFRAHPDFKLRGPLSKASLTGNLAIAESLIYKDIEILPFGVPTTTDIPRPNLPTFSARAPSEGPSTLVDPPFGDWPLDIVVTTADSILIRGNLAKGELTANARIRGTIGQPRPSGTIVTKELKADLPFSKLEVTDAVITLNPDDFDNPDISLRGTSKSSQYTVQIFVSGPLSNPTLSLSSNPPLPENDIMLLVATGSTSSSLEDTDVASQKALQYLLEGLRRRYGNKDKSVLQRLLKNSEQIELSLGDSSQFTGRKYTSATVELGDQWDFTTQIDNEGNTRALVVFSIRFR